jgi:hypothetical protein
MFKLFALTIDAGWLLVMLLLRVTILFLIGGGIVYGLCTLIFD